MPIPLTETRVESGLLDSGKQFGGANLRPQRGCLFQHNPESVPHEYLSSQDKLQNHILDSYFRAGLQYGGESLRLVKNAWPRHGYMRQMVDVPEKN
jgi:hypothetical protein